MAKYVPTVASSDNSQGIITRTSTAPNYRIVIREYKGFYTVEFDSRSLGATLFATNDEAAAQKEFERFSAMPDEEMIEWLNRPRETK